MKWRHLVVKASLLVMGLTPILEAGERTARSTPTICPPLTTHLTSTLLDVFIYPGFTGN